MCGIAGFIQYENQAHPEKLGNKETLIAMGNTITHRGPDAHGEYLEAQVGLCHRRLSIIDLSESGTQPMTSACGRYILVFNGEIYNFPTLREQAQAKGYHFKTQTDSEVILALYAQEGQSCVEKLNGMFAFGIWDTQAQSLFMARDRIGKKPLYYYDNGKDFVFGSEIKAILAHPAATKEINPEAVYDFFSYQYIPDPKTIFKNIYKLKPGHTLTITRDKRETSPYWDLSFSKTQSKSEAETADELLSIINDATQQRMISDVPLGAFLSGGVDSSGIVALMAKNSDKPVTTCSIGFDAKKFDETEYAQQVATQYNTNHHELEVTKNVEDNLLHIASFFDEPFADPSMVPTYFVSQLARQKVTVALAGDGGDESFAGYQKYAVDQIENNLRNKVPSMLRRSLLPKLASLLAGKSSTLLKKGYTLLDTLSQEPDQGFYLTNSFCSDLIWNQLVKPDFKKELNGYHPSTLSKDYYHQCDGPDHLSKILYTDVKTYLPGDILVKVDRMSMANSLEVRAPILDYRVMEYAASIPSNLKLKQSEKKHILKEAFKPLLTDEILYRKKMGFSVPLAEWLRKDLRALAEEKLFSPQSGLAHFFDTHALKELWQKHQNGSHNFSNELWSCLMFELWWQKYA
jgi:asparagine synthase (glutamine-hydrolysing)